MWFSRLFTSSKRRKLRKKPNVARQRRLRVERLEDRKLLAVTISGTIDVSNLTCASGGNVPVSGGSRQFYAQ